MRFLIDADLPRAATRILRRHGHQAVDVRDLGLGAAKDDVIARHAREHGLCLVTGDFDFADIRIYPPSRYPGIVVLVIPGTASSIYIRELVTSFIRQEDVLSELPGKLAIVEVGRIRLRSD